MISKDKLQLLHTDLYSDKETCKNAVIKNYQNLFQLLKVSAQDPYVHSLLPRETNIVWLERGVYIHDDGFLFFDYLSQTHSMYYEKNNISLEKTTRLHKFSFSSWEELIVSSSTSRNATTHLPKNIIVLDDLNIHDSCKKKMETIIWEITFAEYTYFSKNAGKTKELIQKNSSSMREIL